MFQALALYIRDLTIYIVSSALILMLMPKGTFKSYMKLALGLILIALVITPARGIFNEGGNILSGFAPGLNAAPAYDPQRADIILSEFEKALGHQTRLIIEGDGRFTYVSSAIDLSRKESNFGEINGMTITLTPRAPSDQPFSTARPFISVEPVEIGRASAFIPTPEDDAHEIAADELKNIFADFYNLSHDNINIIVQRKRG